MIKRVNSRLSLERYRRELIVLRKAVFNGSIYITHRELSTPRYRIGWGTRVFASSAEECVNEEN